MADNVRSQELSDLMKMLKELKDEVGEIKKKVNENEKSESKKESQTDLGDLAALFPLCGMMPSAFGGSLLFPLGLRMGAARALALGHALDRAATVSSRLAKERDGSDGMPEVMRQVFKAISSQGPDERRILAEFVAKLMASRA